MLDSLFTKYGRVIFFDTVTTGFNADKDDQIIELAAIAVDRNGKITEMDDFIRLETLPQLPETIVNLTGITDLMLSANGLDEEDAIRKFVRMMEYEDPEDPLFESNEVLLVAHNAQFDLLFLAYGIIRHKEKNKGWMKVFNGCDYLDTLTVYKDRRSYPHKLEDAIREYHLAGKVENSHRAVDDCKALFEVVKQMEIEKDDLLQYVNLFGYNPKYGPSGKMLKKVRYEAQGFNNYKGEKLYEKKG